jgi:hypothetical protein
VVVWCAALVGLVLTVGALSLVVLVWSGLVAGRLCLVLVGSLSLVAGQGLWCCFVLVGVVVCWCWSGVVVGSLAGRLSLVLVRACGAAFSISHSLGLFSAFYSWLVCLYHFAAKMPKIGQRMTNKPILMHFVGLVLVGLVLFWLVWACLSLVRACGWSALSLVVRACGVLSGGGIGFFAGTYRLFCWYVSAFLLVRIGFFAGTYRLVLACFFA